MKYLFLGLLMVAGCGISDEGLNQAIKDCEPHGGLKEIESLFTPGYSHSDGYVATCRNETVIKRKSNWAKNYEKQLPISIGGTISEYE